MNKSLSFRIVILLFALLGCSKQEDQIQVTTNTITQIDITQVSGDASVVVGNDAICLDAGICWDTIQNPGRSGNYKVQSVGSGNFSFSIEGLLAETKYYVRAYARGLHQTHYGNQLEFRTKPPFVPGLTIAEITNITDSTAVTGGNIFDSAGAPITERGVCWSSKITNPILNYSDDVYKTNDGAGAGVFTSKLSNLKPNTIYYVRAYSVNKAGVGYSGVIKQFTTTE